MKRTSRFRSLLPAVLGVFLLALASRPAARAWWDGDWPYRKAITIDATAIGEVGTVPVLLRLHDGDFNFGAAKSDGTDLRFVAADDKTLLAYHIEKFDTLLNEAFIWVKVPNVKAGKVSLWLYYGNSGNKAVKVESAKDTYDSDTALVYHFNEHGQPSYDFTGQGNNAANAGIPSDAAMIGTGLRLDGKSAVTIPGSSSLAWSAGGAMTWSAWVKYVAPQPNAVLFSRREGGQMFLVGADAGVPFVAFSSGGRAVRSGGGAALTPGWHHLAVVAAGGRATLYVDGDAFGEAAGELPGLAGEMILGGGGAPGAANTTGFVGEIDELQLSRAARPAPFVKFAAIEQGAEGATRVLTVGPDEQPSSWFGWLKKGYVGVIIGSLTVDGWVVIGLLMVMSAISWGVMVGKGRYLGRIGRSNSAFLSEWHKVAADLSVLDQEEEAQAGKAGAPGMGNAVGMRHSPLYKIYHLGVQEIRNRFSDEDGPRRAISGRSLEAIRASLHGGMTRESARLSSQMVLLTIAISGGPFLGLLGTVVGVMITFAAVAQAGDVNVNAIAPGIAAALAATVAGLFVAIPALFGYNYLLTQIKSATNDMNVFIDEFLTKVAEFYSDDVVD